MRKREAFRLAKKFVKERYPELSNYFIDVELDTSNQERKYSWFFDVRLYDGTYDDEIYSGSWYGYVHADGSIEGLYY